MVHTTKKDDTSKLPQATTKSNENLGNVTIHNDMTYNCISFVLCVHSTIHLCTILLYTIIICNWYFRCSISCIFSMRCCWSWIICICIYPSIIPKNRSQHVFQRTNCSFAHCWIWCTVGRQSIEMGNILCIWRLWAVFLWCVENEWCQWCKYLNIYLLKYKVNNVFVLQRL